MSTENKNNFDWVWYVMGMLTGMLAVFAVTNHIGFIFLGAVFGFIFSAIFLNGIVKGRQY